MIYTLIISYIILLFLSALCSGTENSYCSVNQHTLQRNALEKNAKKSEKLAYKIYLNFSNYLSTILLLNNLINLAISSIAVSLISLLFSQNLAFIGTIISVILIVIFSEIMPKISARRTSLTWTRKASIPLNFLYTILWPITYLFNKLINKLNRLKTDNDEKTETEDIEGALDKIEDEGLVEDAEAELLHNTIDFQDIQVFEIATPRIDIDGIDIEDRLDVTVQISTGARFSRLLVYKGSRDNPLGIIFTKTVLEFLIENPNAGKDELIDYIEAEMFPILYLYKTMPLSTAYRLMKRENIHMAVVNDEFGGTYGIVTMEDVLEELVGEIWDESDVIRPDIKKIGYKTWQIKGSLTIDDFLGRVEVDREDDEYESKTIGGLAWEILGENLKKYDKFKFNSFIFEVRRIEKRRVIFLNATKI